MKRRILSLLLVAALSIGLLSGCGGSSAETPQTNSPAQSQPATTPPENETSPTPDTPEQSEVPAPDTPEETPSEEVSTEDTPASAQPDSDFARAADLLNRALLSPMRTNDAVLDTMVTRILNQITTKNMSTFEKVLACYDYLKKNTVYNHQDEGTLIFNDIYASREDYKLVSLAREIFGTGLGVCDHYAAAFQVLTRRIGLESYICTG